MALVVKDKDLSAKSLSDLAVRRTISGENLMLTRYEVMAGAEFGVHRHPEEQMGYVIRGRIEFSWGNRKGVTCLNPGRSSILGRTNPIVHGYLKTAL